MSRLRPLNYCNSKPLMSQPIFKKLAQKHSPELYLILVTFFSDHTVVFTNYENETGAMLRHGRTQHVNDTMGLN